MNRRFVKSITGRSEKVCVEIEAYAESYYLNIIQLCTVDGIGDSYVNIFVLFEEKGKGYV